MQWQPIETAPRDGTVIYVADPDCGAFPMRWNSEGYNDIFAPYDLGIWEMESGGMTWSESRDCGPTRWKPLEGGCDGWELPMESNNA